MPIRQATALHKHGRSEIDSEEARRDLAEDERFYVIDVAGIPSVVANLGIAEMQSQVYRSARLFVGKKLILKPESAYVRNLGAKVAVTVRFPRAEPITVKHKEVQFWMEAGPLEVLRKFRPRSMMYQGRLEL